MSLEVGVTTKVKSRKTTGNTLLFSLFLTTTQLIAATPLESCNLVTDSHYNETTDLDTQDFQCEINKKNNTSSDEPDTANTVVSEIGNHPGNKIRIVYQDEIYGANLPQDIPDFSYVGYHGGGVPIPMIPVMKTLSPNPSGDDTSRINQAISQVSALPIQANGFRGTLLLKAGTYRVSGTININASGVVLRGEGFSPSGSRILATGTQSRILINIKGGTSVNEVSGTRTPIVSTNNSDLLLAYNSFNVNVQNASNYSVGDDIIIYKNTNDAWIKAVGGEKVQSTPWTASNYKMKFMRTVTKVVGNTITMNSPVPEAIRQSYGGGYVYKYTAPGRIQHVGVENLRLDSTYIVGQENSDEKHAWNGIDFSGIQNGWVDTVYATHFSYGLVAINDSARFITVQNSSMIDPISVITGGRRYSFTITGQSNLVFRNYTRNARHAFPTQAKVSGPNVFLYSASDYDRADSGPHQRWAVGTLYDNIRTRILAINDRLHLGTGHGWPGAQQVFWNPTATTLACQVAPTSKNWLVGGVYRRIPGQFFNPRPQCVAYNVGATPTPQSLYLHQLNKRMGIDAIKALFNYRFP